MDRFFDYLTADQLTEQEPIAKVSWGSQGAPNVVDSETASFDAANPDCCDSAREQSTTTALNDDDLSYAFDSDEALATCKPESNDDEAARTIKRSKIHLVKARDLIVDGYRPEALRAVTDAYKHLHRYHCAMKEAGRED